MISCAPTMCGYIYACKMLRQKLLASNNCIVIIYPKVWVDQSVILWYNLSVLWAISFISWIFVVSFIKFKLVECLIRGRSRDFKGGTQSEICIRPVTRGGSRGSDEPPILTSFLLEPAI